MLSFSDDYFIGFTEGEGCFYVGVVASNDTTNKWQIVHFFKVSQNPSGKVVLDAFKKRLNCGYVKRNDTSTSSDNSLAYVVRDLVSLRDRVIPFFADKLVIKRRDFEVFKLVIDKISAKEHLTKQGFKELVDIIYANAHIVRKYSKEEILKKIPTDYTPDPDHKSGKI